MDEVRMVRDFYPEPTPPTAEEIASAKALLTDPPRRSPSRLRWGLGGTVAAGAAAAVAIAFAGGNAAPAPPGSGRLDGRASVLAAARQAAQQPIGNYWSLDIVDGQSYIIRAATGTYAITGAHGETFNYQGARRGMGEAYYARDLPARPQDAALWRKAGSPSTFRVWSGDHYDTFTTKAAKWQDHGPNVGIDPRGGGDFVSGKSVEDLQNLPADPARLAEMFLNDTEIKKMGARLPGRPWVVPGLKIRRAGALLEAPLPPKVRAGLMRALADQPGVRSIGRDTDPLGRQGVALTTDDHPTTDSGEYGTPKKEQGTYRSRNVMIFDEHTGALLSDQEELTVPGGEYAEMKPGFIINYQADRSAGWTATKPSPPAGLPLG